LVIRFNQPAGGTGYLFYIDIQGNYAIGVELPATNNAAASFKPLKKGTNAAIKKGLNQTNLVAIVANNQTLDVYVNGQYIDSTQDNTYTTGQLGIYGGGDTTASDITASNVRVWRL